MVYGILDADGRTFTYSNGGHCFQVLVNRKSREVRYLDVGGMLIGVFELAEYAAQTIELARDDFLFFYTDGVTETESVDGELFGEERLRAFVEELASLPLEAVCDTVRFRLAEFSGSNQRTDDMTVVAIQVLP